MKWEKTSLGEIRLSVPIVTACGYGTYEIIIAKRPSYCDRGDWLIHMSGTNNEIDWADGFPRYFIGTEDEVKAQMEKWLNRRKAYRDAQHEKEKKTDTT